MDKYIEDNIILSKFCKGYMELKKKFTHKTQRNGRTKYHCTKRRKIYTAYDCGIA